MMAMINNGDWSDDGENDEETDIFAEKDWIYYFFYKLI